MRNVLYLIIVINYNPHYVNTSDLSSNNCIKPVMIITKTDYVFFLMLEHVKDRIVNSILLLFSLFFSLVGS